MDLTPREEAELSMRETINRQLAEARERRERAECEAMIVTMVGGTLMAVVLFATLMTVVALLK